MDAGQPQGETFVRGLVWPAAIICAVAAIDAAWLFATPHALSPASQLLVAQVLLFSGALFGAGWLMRDRARLAILLCGLAFILAAWPALRLLNHLSMTLPFPLADARLARWDAALGFDWHSYVVFFDRLPAVSAAMDWIYGGLTPYSCALFTLLLLTRDPARGCLALIRLFVATAAVCTLAGALFPARAAMAHYGYPAGTFENFSPGTGAYHLESLLALRSGAAQSFELFQLPGLVTFPSFHTAMGVIAIWCARRSPWLFWPMLAVNLLMIASTPIYGSHYGIDVVAGAVVAALAIALCDRSRSLGGRKLAASAVYKKRPRQMKAGPQRALASPPPVH